MAWTRKLPSGRYQACYRDASGSMRTAGTFQRKGDAQDAAAEQERSVRRGEWIDPRKGRESFAIWAEHYMQTTLHLRPTSRQRDVSYLRHHLLPHFGNRSLSQIEPIDVQRWVVSLSESKAPETVAKCYGLLSRMMALAADSGYINGSPCRGVKLPRIERHEMRFLTARQLEYLTEHHPERARTIVLLGGYMGLRWGEIAGLKRERLNLLQGTLEIRETLVEVGGRLSFGAPKSDAGRRTLRLPDFLVDNLREHLDRFTTHPELVFTGRDGGPYRRGNFRRRYWLPAVEAAVLSPLRFHDLRHTAAGLLIAENVHPKIIQRRLGHSSISVTLDRYGHLLPDLEEQVAESLDTLHHSLKAEDSAAHMLHAPN